MVLLLLYLSLAIVVSFLCSLMEAVLLSTPVSFLKMQEEKGHKSAAKFIAYKKNIDLPLSAILSLNTIANTMGAAGVGAQATVVFGEAYFGIVSAVLTILILIFSEIIPKTIGARYCRQISHYVGGLIGGAIFLSYPLVLLSKSLTKFIIGKQDEQTVSREEISALANIGALEGIFGENENKIIQNLLLLKTVTVSEIMTPRVVVAIADQEMSLEEFLDNKELLQYSRIPIYNESSEDITGYVLRQTVFEKLAEEQELLKLLDVRRPIVFVPKTKPLLDVWEFLLEKKEHIAMVIDEYGGMAGLVTMEDVVETLLGLEIVDEKDKIVDMRQHARDRWNSRKMKYSKLNK